MYMFMYMYGWLRDFSQPFIPALEPNLPRIQWVPSISRVKAAGSWPWPPTPSNAEVKERVELHLYSPPDFRGLFLAELYFYLYVYGWTDGWLCVCARACVHPVLYVHKHAWISAHVLSVCVCVCVCVCLYMWICRVIQEESTLLWEMIEWVILSKKFIRTWVRFWTVTVLWPLESWNRR